MLLLRQQRATIEVVRNAGRYAQQYFGAGFSEPDVFFAVDVELVRKLGREVASLVNLQATDQRDTEVL